MNFSRRSFMQMLLGAATVSAANVFTDNAIAKAIIELPEDKYVKTVRLVRESILANDILTKKREALGFNVKGHSDNHTEERAVWSKTEEYEQFLRTVDNTLQFIVDSYEPGTADETELLFRNYLKIDILSEAELRSVTDGVIPVAIARAMIQTHRMPFDVQRMPSFDNFAEKYRGQIMGSASFEFNRLEDAIREAERGPRIGSSTWQRGPADPELVERAKKALVDYVLNRAKSPALIV